MIDFSRLKIVPAKASHQEFAYLVKKQAMGPYIKQLWGWDEQFQQTWSDNDWLNKPPQIVLYGDKPIGTIRIIEDDSSIHIERLYLLPKYQNKGIGSHLLIGILNKAQQTGRSASLCVLKINPAKNLYLRHGFSITGEEEHLYFMECKPEKQSEV